ncbi:MAG: DUF4830 domain-containing protein [Oscillospiraceae bacterium]|nr:DUF4830 domain-containing protein [Oscillospiraceae bacterium]
MFVVTLKSNKIMRAVIILFVALLIVLLTVFGSNVLCSGVSKASAVSGKADIVKFISNFGWITDSEPLEVKTVVIPEEFDDVYENYNKIQLQQGYDLSKYCGREVERYTFKVKNYPNFENDDTIRVNVLVYDGSIIGGDVCSVRLDGFMHGFEAVKE